MFNREREREKERERERERQRETETERDRDDYSQHLLYECTVQYHLQYYSQHPCT